MDVVTQILDKHRPIYQKSIEHPLTNELCRGTLSDDKLFVYLVQDAKYFQLGLSFFAKTLSLCDSHPSAIIMGKQIGFICTDENDYFDTTLKNLKNAPLVQEKVPGMLVAEPPTLKAVKEYLDYLKYLVHECNSYIELVTALFVMEQVYLGWADLNLDNKSVPADLDYKYNEWIRLHSGEDFSRWVGFLRDEINRTVKTSADFLLCETTFIRVLDLEIDFFGACYSYKE